MAERARGKRTYAEGRAPHATYETGRELHPSLDEGRKPHLTLATGRKVGSGLNPNSWQPRNMTEEMMNDIIQSVSRGQSFKRAWEGVGLSGNGYTIWTDRADNGDTEAQEFITMVNKASAWHEDYLLSLILKAAQTNWTAAGWSLERIYQERYALQTKLTGKLEVDNVTARESLQAEAKMVAESVNSIASSVTYALPPS